jgi:small GTP-binding protein
LFGPGVDPKRIVLIGLDAAGKTTFLYRIKERAQEVVTTIPTIGFNVETLQTKDLDFTCWDIGGCDKIRPLWRHYMQNLSGLILMIDSNDRDRFPDAHTEFQFFLNETPAPVLVISNKIDLPNSRPLDEVIKGLKLDELHDRYWEIMPASVMLKESADPCLRWIQEALSDPELIKTRSIADQHGGISSRTYFRLHPLAASPVPPPPPPPTPVDNTTPEEKAKLQQQVREHDHQKLVIIWRDWIQRSAQLPPATLPPPILDGNSLPPEVDEETFLSQIATYSLLSWDHYTHIRMAFIFLKRSSSLREGYTQIANSIANYIANNTVQTNGKSFHATMTRFWCHLVAYWMAKWRNSDQEKQLSEEEKRETIDFHRFLQFVCLSRQVDYDDLSQSTLFKTFFTNGVLFHPSARAQVTPPDVQSLPDFSDLLERNEEEDMAFLREEPSYWKTPQV